MPDLNFSSKSLNKLHFKLRFLTDMQFILYLAKGREHNIFHTYE